MNVVVKFKKFGIDTEKYYIVVKYGSEVPLGDNELFDFCYKHVSRMLTEEPKWIEICLKLDKKYIV